MDDLIARLRDTRQRYPFEPWARATMIEAADRIEELETENERLLNALEHYAEPRSATLSDEG